MSDLYDTVQNKKLELTKSISYMFISIKIKLKIGHFESGEVRHSILNKPGGRFMMAIVAFPKVLCAAVQGPIIGIAATALLQCDLVFFSDQAFFWAPFTRLALGKIVFIYCTHFSTNICIEACSYSLNISKFFSSRFKYRN